MPTGGPIGDAYLRAVLAGRSAGYRLTAQGRERMMAAFQRMLVDVTRLSAEGTMTPERAATLKKQVDALLARFQREWGGSIDATTGGTLRATMDAHAAALREVSALTGRTVSVDFDLVPPVVSQVLAYTRKADTFRSLMTYRMENVRGEVDDLLRGAIGRSQSGAQTTVDLARLLASDDPEALAGLEKVRAKIKDTTLARKLTQPVSRIDLERYGLSPGETQALRSLLGDARRIAVSETANTMRESNAVTMTLNPTVEAGTWTRSSRHAYLPSSPDICDAHAIANRFGFGEGVWPFDRWPLSHPHCMCYQAGPIHWRPIREWGQPKTVRPMHNDPSLKAKLRALAERAGVPDPERFAARVYADAVDAGRLISRDSLLGKAAASKPAPARRSPAPAPKPAPTPPVRLASTSATPAERTPGNFDALRPFPEVDRALADAFQGFRDQLAGLEAMAERLAQAIDAPGLGWNVRDGAPTSLRWVFNDAEATRRQSAGTAYWSGHIGLDTEVTAGLNRVRNNLFGDKGLSSWTRQEWRGVKTTIHEIVHMRSGTRKRWDYALGYGDPRGKAIEEGLTEWRARTLTARAVAGMDNYDDAFRAFPQFQAAGSYQRWTSDARWWVRLAGEDAAEALYAEGALSERLRLWAAPIRARAREYIAALPAPFRPHAERWLNGLTDEAVYDAMEEWRTLFITDAGGAMSLKNLQRMMKL